MKSLMLLCETVLKDLGTRCCVSTNRDLKTIAARFEHEGLSFLMITLPAFGKDFQKSLSQGRVDHNMFAGFSRHGGLPRFLGGFLDLVFDRSSGQLLHSADVDAIYSIRQICLMFEKIEHESSSRRIRDTINSFMKCEQDVKIADRQRTEAKLSAFHRLSTILWGNPMQHVNNCVQAYGITPRHGPGATADRLTSNGKYNLRSWTERLDGVFPYEDFLLANPHYYEDNHVDILEPGSELPSRLTHVPKTLKAPRLIAIEPTAMQYAQQGIQEQLVYHLEHGHDTPFPWLIGFEDQKPNRLMAQKGSTFGGLATLDLSDASDSVSNQLVLEMTSRMPFLSAAIQACRSRKVDIPGYGVKRVAKFASMGSALTFPIEAMVFAAIVFVGIESKLNCQMTGKMIQSFRGKVRIYGDDIIVPVEYTQSVIDALESFGFKVNRAKSFWTGKFRESCGGDYYDGVDITVTRLRRLPPTSRKSVPELISFVSFRNQCYYAGLWETTRLLDRWIKGIIPFPTVDPTSPVLGRWSRLGFETQRTHPDLQIPLVKGYVVSNRSPRDCLEGHGALLKYLLKRGPMPFADSRHLERSGRPYAASIKHKWAPAVSYGINGMVLPYQRVT